jgi:hypothetical protein
LRKTDNYSERYTSGCQHLNIREVVEMSNHSKLKNDVEIVESFIQGIHDSEIIIDQSARDIPFTKYELEQPPQRRNLADVLALMFETYNEHKNDNLKEFSAKICARWIEKARIFGVVKEGEGLTLKLRDCNSEKEQLQKTIDEISDRNIHLEFENRDLHSQLEESEKFQRLFVQENK